MCASVDLCLMLQGRIDVLILSVLLWEIPLLFRVKVGFFPPSRYKLRWTGIGARKGLFIPDLLQRNVKALGSLLLLLVYCLLEDHHLHLLKRERERLRSNGCHLS